MKLDKLTIKSQELFQSAHGLADWMNHQAIEPVHFLHALLNDDQGVVLSIFRKINV
jgi:ATP-dependent Clp protease ATP-binding subunit ClpB